MSEPNDDIFERIHSAIPGARTNELSPALLRVESRNVTYVDEEFPVFWESAAGATVTDVDGNRYLDLTSAFGVANTGHSNPHVAAAIHDQAVRLMHAMGDVHPTEVKIKLLEKLTAITPPGLDKVFLASTGAEAVEAALKTAIIATGRSAFAAFHGAYHGLTFGALSVSGIEKFRAPFLEMLPRTTEFLEYPRADVQTKAALGVVRQALQRRGDIAAVIIEPIQGRGGCIIPPPGYLDGLRELCTELGILLIFDEIYTGFGRTGTMFACQYDNVIPDIICIGKAMANGFPISAMLARADIMDAWPVSRGEALHTSTYLGNPMGCAAALANIDEIERLRLATRADELGRELGARLDILRRDNQEVLDVRGRGLMWGIELEDGASADRLVKNCLKKGLIVLQAGQYGEVVSLTPPLVIERTQLFRAVDIIEGSL